MIKITIIGESHTHSALTRNRRKSTIAITKVRFSSFVSVLNLPAKERVGSAAMRTDSDKTDPSLEGLHQGPVVQRQIKLIPDWHKLSLLFIYRERRICHKIGQSGISVRNIDSRWL